MTLLRTTLTLTLIIVVVLLAAGCAERTEAANQTTTVPMVSHSATLAPSVILTDTAGSKEPLESLYPAPTVIPLSPVPYNGSLVDIDNFTEFIAVGAGSNDELQSIKALDGRDYNIPVSTTKFDVVMFRNIALYKKITEEPSISMKIRGKNYQASLTRTNDVAENFRPYTYTGLLKGEPDSDILLTVGTDVFTATFRIRNETYTITPFETQLSALKHTSSIHITYSSKDLLAAQPFCIDSCVTPTLKSSHTRTILPVTTTSQHKSESTLANANELAADFYPSSNEGFTPYTVGLIDTSSGLPTSWHWDFDDGTFSDERSPIHTFYNATEPNTLKTVTLTIRRGTAISTKSVDLLIHPPYPFPDFEASSLNGSAPLTVYFTDTSFGLPGANEWVFGDGFISYESHPHHTYKNPGVYEVKLIISTPMATRSKNATITVQ